MLSEQTWLALGDSTAVGVGARNGGYAERALAKLRGRGIHLRLDNRAQSGATARDVLRVVARPLPRARLVTLSVGVNDLRRGVGPEAFAAQCAAILERVETCCDGTIVVTNLPDASHAPILPDAMRPVVAQAIRAYNEALARVVTGRRRLFDLHTTSGRVLGSRDDLFCFDGFHPSDAGYEVWSDDLVEALVPLLAA